MGGAGDTAGEGARAGAEDVVEVSMAAARAEDVDVDVDVDADWGEIGETVDSIGRCKSSGKYWLAASEVVVPSRLPLPVARGEPVRRSCPQA